MISFFDKNGNYQRQFTLCIASEGYVACDAQYQAHDHGKADTEVHHEAPSLVSWFLEG